ncbi:MAG: DUF1800 domain-containing protein [Proteobacteria bacterium]|nr:DUF1800 domain-containing protein [Pseudomonadota bacterium]
MKISRLLGLLTLMALGSQSHAAGRADVFDAKGDYAGASNALTLSASISPAAVDAGLPGSYYVAALYGSNLLFLSPTGWAPYAGAQIPSAVSGTLSQLSIPLLANADISALECASIIAGYGKDANDMATNGLYRTIYQVPARIPHASPLPCSAMADADISRFLEQASFGPTDASIADVKLRGLSGWLANQVALPRTGYVPPSGVGDWTYYPESQPASCTNDGIPTSWATLCLRDNYSLYQVQREFFQNAISAPDQLRQRVAFALSQILVISGTDSPLAKPYAFVPYQNILLDNAFGNYETILNKITLSPAMGRYLDMANNPKATNANQQPNENYARELLQLFSIGLYKLNLDGSVQTDAAGIAVPSYDENVIKGFAKTFTGWTYAPVPGAASQSFNPIYFGADMVVVEKNHDTTSKQLLDTTVLPAGQTSAADLTAAVHTAFMHPNVGPFIGRQLIQRLVTSNPSPAYVSRVASVFNDNGSGARGDMQAVIRAILLDTEARGGMRSESNYGHLREPALFIARFYRSLGGISDGVWLKDRSNEMGQNLFYPDTVFNYYPADYALASGQAAPEFGIQNTATALARANFVYSAILGTPTGNTVYAAQPSATVIGATGTYLDLTPYVALAPDPAALIDRLNILLLHGSMAPETRTQLISTVTGASSDPKVRAQTAIYLVANLPQFMVER